MLIELNTNSNKINKKFLGISIFLFTLSILLSNIPEIKTQSTNSINDEMRIKPLLEILERFKGKSYSTKIDINFDSNKFKCSTNSQITPKEYSFFLKSGHSICSDKIFENFEILAEKIKDEINKNFEPKILANINFLKDFKHVLYFAYQLTYIQFISQSEKKIENPKDNFFDPPKISFTQNDILDILENLQSLNQNFNIFEINNEDLKILNNYLHVKFDFNILEVKEKIDKIIENIEKDFRRKDVFKNWISLINNSNKIKYVKFFIGLIWRNGIHVDFK